MTRIPEPPADVNAEAAVLGSVLLDNEQIAIASVLRPEDFHREAHRDIWRAMQHLDAHDEPIELRTLTDTLARDGALARVGGVPALIGLADGGIIGLYAESYVRIVREKAVLRGIITASQRAMQAAYDATNPASDILEQAEASFLALSAGRAATEGGQAISEPLMEVFRELGEPAPLIPHVTWGLPDLDDTTNGLEPGALIILAARPGMGKTALALQTAAFNATRKRSVLMFSLEMSARQLAARLLSGASKVDLQRLRSRDLAERDFTRMSDKMSGLLDLPLRVDDDGGLTVSDMRRRCRLVQARHGLDLVIVDYLQLMSDGAAASRGGNRVAEVSAISRGLKVLARELDVPVVALSHLSRAVESRPDKRPVLSDLRESGQIEGDADVVAFLYRDEYYDKGTSNPGVAEVIIAKQRSGPTTTVNLAWMERTTSFESLARREYTSEEIMAGVA